MKKRIIIVLGILIAAGGIGTGVWYHFKGNSQSGTGDSIVYVSKVSVITGSETTAVNRFAGVVAVSYTHLDVYKRQLRKENKDTIKYALYQLLIKLTGRTLPWGNLTGIRPAKLAMGRCV